MEHGVREQIQGMAEWLVEVRRDFHRHPELAYQEHRTSGVVAERLRGWGLEVKSGVAETGVIGLWHGEGQGPVLGIRADMDALPIQEVEDRPYGSRNPGVMHACGHDAHITMALGAARYLAEHASGLRGGVKFIFQPAEEGGGGGHRMVSEGALDDPQVDRILALHVLPLLPSGRFGITHGAAHASADQFAIRLRGLGSHAAYPHRAKDPILAACALVQALQGVVSRSTDPLDSLVLSVTRIQSGTTFNVIPEEAALWGTIRALKEDVREDAHGQMRRIARGVADAHGVQADVEINRGYPVLKNDAEVLSFAEGVARSVVGSDSVVELPPSMGSEDFSYFLDQCPGAYLRIGFGGNRPDEFTMLHTPQFDLDEGVLPMGVEFLVRCSEAFLGAG